MTGLLAIARKCPFALCSCDNDASPYDFQCHHQHLPVQFRLHPAAQIVPVDVDNPLSCPSGTCVRHSNCDALISVSNIKRFRADAPIQSHRQAIHLHSNNSSDSDAVAGSMTMAIACSLVGHRNALGTSAKVTYTNAHDSPFCA